MSRFKFFSKSHIWKTAPGKPEPLGATFYPDGVNFAVVAGHATEIRLILYYAQDDNPCDEIVLDAKINKTKDVWHVYVYGLSMGMRYGYRAFGPKDQQHCYNEACVLIDPYAHALGVPGQPLEQSNTWGWDKPKPSNKQPARFSILTSTEFNWENDCHPKIHPSDLIIYELHVRGFTQHISSNVSCPGTYSGIIAKLPYLKELGINAIELLPIAEFDENDHMHRNPETGEKLRNFWGYNTIGFRCPKAAYAVQHAQSGQIKEFQTLVKACHAAGIEVILDMVFNHTAEGNQHGPILHFKGLDNCVYYILSHGNYRNYTGCGNTVSANHPTTTRLILDCLKFWVTQFHIDGFRFDLASALTRDTNGHPLSDPLLMRLMTQDPILQNTKLIAEAWDAGGLYQVGSFPGYGRFSEWNGKFRDDIRSFMKGDNGFSHAVSLRLLGSPDLYQGSNRPPFHSINFVTCHDGFTLHDLISYNQKHNQANGEGNRDGTNDNRSWNCGEEGPTSNVQVYNLRQRQAKNFLTLLMLSQGVPMLLAGDEFGRTQNGNNNAYCQDNEISWVNWDLLNRNRNLFRFTKELIALRNRHRVLRSRQFGEPRVHWHGTKIGQPDWAFHSHSLALTIEALSPQDYEIYIAINAYWEPLEFQVPSAMKQKPWRIVINTAENTPQDIVAEEYAAHYYGNTYRLESRSILVLMA